jgi:hypothetical protein
MGCQSGVKIRIAIAIGWMVYQEFDFTASVCAVELGKDRQKIVWT